MYGWVASVVNDWTVVARLCGAIRRSFLLQERGGCCGLVCITSFHHQVEFRMNQGALQ